MNTKEIKEQIIKAGEKAVIQLIKVAKEDIIKYDKDIRTLQLQFRTNKSLLSLCFDKKTNKQTNKISIYL